MPLKLSMENGPPTSECTSSNGCVLSLVLTLMIFHLCLAWIHSVHIESSFEYPSKRDHRAVGPMWAWWWCHSRDSGIVGGFRVGFGNYGGRWILRYSDMCAWWYSFSLPLASSWSGLRRHSWYSRSECSCRRSDFEIIDLIACDGDWWRWYGALITSKCGCGSGCVELIDGGKREPECRGE